MFFNQNVSNVPSISAMKHIVNVCKLLDMIANKRTLVREGSSYHQNRTLMSMSISVPANLVMKRMIQFIVRLNLFRSKSEF